MITKRWLLVLFSVVLVLFTSAPSLAYHEDVHFNLTYVLCRLAGLSANDALWVAAANQSMDDNYSTTAYTGNPVGTIFRVDRRYNGLMWHDFCDDGCRSDTKNAVRPYTISFASSGGGIGATAGDGGGKARRFIKERYNTLWERVKQIPPSSEDTNRITADIVLGQFLHYEQDFYSHRQFVGGQAQEENDNAYWPYGTKWGHAADGDGTTADQVRLRPYLAKKMIFDCYTKIQQFAGSRGISSPAETEATLALLVDALADAYGSKTFTSKVLGYTSYDFPSQTALNNKLNSCLTTSFASTWPKAAKLPVYEGGGFTTVHGPLTLPYDDYKANQELLSTWIAKIKAVSDAL